MPTDRDFRYDLRPALQPALLPAWALAGGIAAGGLPGLRAESLFVAAAACAALAALLRMRFGRGRATLAVCLVATAFFGAARGSGVRAAARARPLAQLVEARLIRPGDAVVLEGVLETPPVRPPGRARLRLRVSRVAAGGLGEREIAARVWVTVGLRTPADEVLFEALGLEYGGAVRIASVVEDDLAYRNPGVASLRDRLRGAGMDLAVRCGPSAIVALDYRAGCPLLAALYRARERGLRAIDAAYPVRTSGLLRALLLGDGSRLDRETSEQYRRTGIFHLLVVSGAHVTLVAALLVWPVARLTRSPLARFAAGAAPIWAYTLALGSPPPAVRASLALTLAMTAPLLGRRAPPANTVAVAAIVVLACDPAALFDSSFQLTFAAVAAIVLLAAPPLEQVGQAGRWRPGRATPYPPVCAEWVRATAETLYWSPRRFEREQGATVLQFRPDKARAAPILDRFRLQGLARRVAQGLWITLVVQVALVPVSIAHFHRVAPIALASTLLAEVLLGAALVAGFVFLCAWAVSEPLAVGVAPLAGTLVEWAGGIVSAAASVEWADLRVPAPTGWRAALPWAALGLLALFALVGARWRTIPRTVAELGGAPPRGVPPRGAPPRGAPPRGAPRLGRACAVGILALAAALALPPERPPGDGKLHVVFLDVGQGDATLIRFPTGETMLVDAGGRPPLDQPLGFEEGEPVYAERFDVGERVVCPALWSLGVNRLDLIVASHGDVDHIGGFEAILANMAVGRALVGGDPDARERRFHVALARAGVPLTELRVGEAFHIGGVGVEVLWPDADTRSANDRSLVLRLVYGRRALLLTGDVEQRAELAMLRRGQVVAADVLKVPHHGSRTSSSPALLAAVSPRWAVVPAPRLSPYGHPSAEVIDRLRVHGARAVQTGLEGAVEVVTDGEEMSVTALASGTTFPAGGRE